MLRHEILASMLNSDRVLSAMDTPSAGPSQLMVARNTTFLSDMKAATIYLKTRSLRYLRENIKHFDGEFVGANLSYDVDYGYNDGFEWHPDAKFRDVQIADPLLYELHLSYSLKAIGERYGIESKDETVLLEAARSFGLDPKKGLWRLPGRYVGQYAEQDVASPLELLRRQERRIDDEGLREDLGPRDRRSSSSRPDASAWGSN
jgi:hypothetical protein